MSCSCRKLAEQTAAEKADFLAPCAARREVEPAHIGEEFLLDHRQIIYPVARQCLTCVLHGGHSSVAEHSTADREVTGSTPVAPCV